MRLRYGGTTVDLKLASAKAWAYGTLVLFIFSTVYLLSHTRHSSGKASGSLDEPRHPNPRRRENNNGAHPIAPEGINPQEMSLKFHPAIPVKMPHVQVDEGRHVDVVNNNRGNDEDKVKFLKMAMHPAKANYKKILQKQKQILTKQDRPPDKHYNINITLSDTISMDRIIRDTRPPVCRTFHYDRSSLMTATVVIPFFNEALSMLLRTIHSILNNSPDELLHEIILVDDMSTRDYLKDTFGEYVEMLPKTRIIRNTKREGLIVSRMIGSRSTTAPVVIFLDAHTEANVGWLEPLLDELERHPNSVIQPFVDGIEAWTIEYTAPPSIHKGVFSWDLQYRWQKVPDHEAARAIETGYPFFSPTLVGCAIAVKKSYFEHIGEFDDGLKVWGGENLELGFRTWMCGGRVVTVVCSRVGHVFKNFPYKFDGNREEIVTKNLMRVTETWMDSYRKYYYATARLYDFKRGEFTPEEIASLSERIELRKRLQCQNFEWFMHNVVPDIETPPTDAVYYGEISSLKTQACWEPTDDYYIGMNYICYEHKIIPNNYFHINRAGQFKYRDKCVHFEPPKPALRLGECPGLGVGEELDPLDYGVWDMQNKGHVWGLLKVKIKNRDGKVETYCAIQVTNVFVTEHNRDQMPQMTRCDENNQFQLWAWTYKFAWEETPKRLIGINKVGKQDHFIV